MIIFLAKHSYRARPVREEKIFCYSALHESSPGINTSKVYNLQFPLLFNVSH